MATSNDLRISLSTTGVEPEVHVIRVDGRIDTLTAGELDEVIGTLLRRGSYRQIIDLAGSEYISSAGWGVFVSRLREARDGGGDIKLARMTNPVREVYDLLEFEGLLPRYARLEDAQAQFGVTEKTLPDAPAETPLDRPRTAGTRQPLLETLATPTAAVLNLICEDPFYNIGELKARLREIGHAEITWWDVWSILRRQKLLRLRRRFAYFRGRLPIRG